MTVIYVDDSMSNMELFAEAITLINPSIELLYYESCTKTYEALSQASTPPDYIFLNIDMPLNTVKEIILKIRTSDQMNLSKVIMFTDFLGQDEIEGYNQIGISTFMVKPDSVINLQIMLRLIFGLSRR